MIHQTIAEWIAKSGLPRLESRLLLQHVTSYSHAQLLTHDNEPLNAMQISQLNDLWQRRKQGEPMAYLLGTRAFYGHDFCVSPAVLIPRPETELLLETALSRLPSQATLWDLGTGSGIVAVSVKLVRPDVAVYASDVCADALNVAKHNAQRLGAQITWAEGSWCEAAHQHWATQRFDVMVSNPPYIEQDDPHLKQGDLRFEPTHALTDFGDGLQHIRQLAQQSPVFLKSGGSLLLEHGYNQGEKVRQILQENGFQKIETLHDLSGWERVSCGVKI